MITDHTKNEIYYRKGTGVVQFEDSDESKCFATTGDLCNYLHKNETGDFISYAALSGYVQNCETGNFVNQQVLTGYLQQSQTGNFLTNNSLTGYALNCQTGNFLTTGCLSNYLLNCQTGNFALTCNTLSLNTFNSFIGTGYMEVDPSIPIVFVNSLKVCNAFYQSVKKTGVVNASVQLHTSCPTNWIGTGGSNSASLVFQLPPTGELIPNDIGLTFKAINLSTNNSHMCFKQGAADIIFAGQGCVATVIWDGQCWNGFNF